MLKKIDLLVKIEELGKKVAILEQKINEQDVLLKAVKEVSTVKRQSDEIKKKQKWLNGYPDDSEGDI
jgi:hypothetical protein